MIVQSVSTFRTPNVPIHQHLAVTWAKLFQDLVVVLRLLNVGPVVVVLDHALVRVLLVVIHVHDHAELLFFLSQKGDNLQKKKNFLFRPFFFLCVCVFVLFLACPLRFSCDVSRNRLVLVVDLQI